MTATGDVIPVAERPSGRFPSWTHQRIGCAGGNPHGADVQRQREEARHRGFSKDLHARPGNWLKVVAKDMTKITERD